MLQVSFVEERTIKSITTQIGAASIVKLENLCITGEQGAEQEQEENTAIDV